MANNILVGLTIGARLASNFRGAMGETMSALGGLKRSGTTLRVEHERMGKALARSIAEPIPHIRELRAQYDQLGNSLVRLEARNKALATSMRASEALRSQRANLRGEMMDTAVTGTVVAAPILASISIATGFQEKMRDTRITGGMSAGEEASLSKVVRSSAKQFNQTQDEVATGIGVLVAGGISNAKELAAYAPMMAKSATATKSSMDDVGATAIAMSKNLMIGAKDFESSFTMLAYAGKKGQFEVRDMAKWLPSLSPQFAALGITGKRAVAEIGASLQVARMGAGSNDEAANNFRNFLAKITSPDTLKDFAKAGIDLKGSMQNLVSQGMTPMQAMLKLIQDYMGKQGPGAAAALKQTLAIKDDQERQAAMQRLTEAYKLGELFQDQQAMAFIRPAIEHQQDLQNIQKGAMGAGDSGLLDADLKLRMETSAEQGKRFKVAMSEIALTLGNTLLPAVNSLVEGVVPMLERFESFASKNPGLIKGVLGVAGALIGGKLAMLGLRYGLNLLISPFAAARQAKDRFMAGWSVFQSMRAAGQFAPLATGLRRITGLLSGRLLSGLRLAGQGVLWLGRAMLMNPIGLLVTAIAIGAYLIYRNWDKIKGVLMAGWRWMKVLASTFYDAGGHLITGLIGGVLAKVGAAKATIVKLGGDIKGWFASTLGIKSPSRVFMGFGDNIAQGAALGIRRSTSLASAAAGGMAKAAVSGWGKPGVAQGAAARADLAANLSRSRQQSSMPAAGAAGDSGMQITFSPQITVQGGGDVRDQVAKALELSFTQFERLMKRYESDRMRRSYGTA